MWEALLNFLMTEDGRAKGGFTVTYRTATIIGILVIGYLQQQNANLSAKNNALLVDISTTIGKIQEQNAATAEYKQLDFKQHGDMTLRQDKAEAEIAGIKGYLGIR